MGVRAAARYGALVLTVASAVAAGDASHDVVEVPGGAGTFARRLGFPSGAAEDFLATLNHALLEGVDPDHDTDRVGRRVALLELLARTRSLRARLGERTEISPSPDGLRRFAGLAEQLGYELRTERAGRLALLPVSGSEGARRRAVERALEVQLVRGLEELRGGRSFPVVVPDATAQVFAQRLLRPGVLRMLGHAGGGRERVRGRGDGLATLARAHAAGADLDFLRPGHARGGRPAAAPGTDPLSRLDALQRRSEAPAAVAPPIAGRRAGSPS